MPVIKKRESGIELLRILCMIMVLFGHYYTKGGYTIDHLTPISINTVYIQFLQMFARIACAIFVLITGFYSLEKKDCSGHYKKIIELLFEMYFYSLLSLILMEILSGFSIRWKYVFQSMFPFLWGNWFVEYYILLYGLIPFINKLIRNLDRKEFIRLLVLIYFMWSLIPTLTRRAWEFSNLDFMIVFYITGAYIKKYGIVINKKWKLYTIISILLILLSVIAFDFIGEVTSINYFIEHAGYLKEFSSIVAVPCSIGIFLFFKSVNFSSGLVNRIARTTLGVYLFSDNFLMQELIWKSIYPNNEFIQNPFFHSVIKVTIVFCGCVIIDIIRMILFVFLNEKMRLTDKVYGVISKLFKKLENYFVWM